jgi:quercetin dioxygenase-like cupin family protein
VGTKAGRKRLSIFRAADAAPLPDAMMRREVADEPTRDALARLAAAGVSAGLGERNQVLFAEAGDAGMSLLRIWFKSGYVLPPHSHDVDCLYYVIAGELRLGAQVLRSGDGFFVPADSGYSYEAGPEGVELLEFRNATRFSIRLRGGQASRWDRVAEAFRERGPAWKSERVPPSARGDSR